MGADILDETSYSINTLQGGPGEGCIDSTAVVAVAVSSMKAQRKSRS